MDLEQAKAAWQRHKRAVAFSRMTVKEQIEEIKRICEARDRRFKNSQLRLLLIGITVLIFLACCLDRRLSILSNIGLGMMILCFSVWLISTYVLQRNLRETHYELPEREFEMAERAKTMAQIHHLKWSIFLLLPATCLGFLLWQVAPGHSLLRILLASTAVVASYILSFWFFCKMRKQPLALLEAIDEELRRLALAPQGVNE